MQAETKLQIDETVEEEIRDEFFISDSCSVLVVFSFQLANA